MLTAIFGKIAGSLVGLIFDRLGAAWEAYVRKEISREEAHARMVEALISGASQVEVAQADSLARTYDSFMQHGMRYGEVRAVWIAVTVSQLLVLLWHQMGIPLVIATGLVRSWPSSGATAEWGYALLAGCLGFGAIMMRSAPGVGLAERARALVGR